MANGNSSFGELLDEPKLAILKGHFKESGAYYTSYPAMGAWNDSFKEADYLAGLKDYLLHEGRDEPLHLYVHIPFCAKLCYYCICNMTVTDDRSRIREFIQVLLKEIALLRKFFDQVGVAPKIKEIHFGGGTPSYLDREEFRMLCEGLQAITDLKSLDEFAMEIDPRTTDPESLLYFASFGVNRISFGVQDFDAAVQKAINRVQPYEMVDRLLTKEVRKAFRSINFDLLYGLPLQTRETFRNTLSLVKELAPQRVSLLKYAHVPNVRKHMRAIKDGDLPESDDLPLMYIESTQDLLSNGYEWIGIDYFASHDDDLAQAAREEKVCRIFNGYSPGRTRHIIGLGPTSSMAFGDYYAQSYFDLKDYYAAIDNSQLPILRGYKLSADDAVRRAIMFELICKQRVDFSEIDRQFGIDSSEYFSEELEELHNGFSSEEIVEFEGSKLQITTFGRFFIRNVCRVFDTFYRGKDYSIPRPFLKGNRSVL